MTIPEDKYDPNIPQPQDELSDSQSDMLNNFLQLYAQFAKNHVAFLSAAQSSSADQGKHKLGELMASSLDVQTNIDQTSVYTKLDANKAAQLFMRFQGNRNALQYSAYQSHALTPNDIVTSLPGGFILQTGLIAPRPNPQPLEFTKAMKQVYCVHIFTNALNASSYWFPVISGSNKVDLYYSPSNDPVPASAFYIVIGRS